MYCRKMFCDEGTHPRIIWGAGFYAIEIRKHGLEGSRLVYFLVHLQAAAAALEDPFLLPHQKVMVHCAVAIGYVKTSLVTSRNLV